MFNQGKGLSLFPYRCHWSHTYHRITESQNVRGWKGPLWVI